MGFRCFCARALLACALLMPLPAEAHPIPEITFAIEDMGDHLLADISIPMNEFLLVFDLGPDVSNRSVAKAAPDIAEYLSEHIAFSTPEAAVLLPQTIEAVEMRIAETSHGTQVELWAHLTVTIPEDAPQLTLASDLVLHRVVTDVIAVTLIQQDAAPKDLGVIAVNPTDRSIPPVVFQRP